MLLCELSKGDVVAGAKRLDVITGQGLHSAEGPKLLPALTAYLEQAGLEFSVKPRRDGVIIDLTSDPGPMPEDENDAGWSRSGYG